MGSLLLPAGVYLEGALVFEVQLRALWECTKIAPRQFGDLLFGWKVIQ